jgi:hypothetical protein
MVITYDIEASCPICGSRLLLHEPGGCFPLGQDSDLLLRMEGRHVIQVEIHSCLRCRYAGYPRDFAASFQRALCERFLSEISPKMAGDEGPATPSDVQYLWAYRRAAFLGKSEEEQGLLLLRAFWCLRLPPSADLPAEVIAGRRRIYLAGAIHHLRQGARDGASPMRLYLLAELSRRAGQFPVATGYFKRFLDACSVRDDVPKYLRLAAAKLLASSERSESRDMTMEELVYADSPD